MYSAQSTNCPWSFLKKAKRKGYVVIIGHPKKETIIALRQSRPSLMELELMSVSEFFAFILGGDV